MINPNNSRLRKSKRGRETAIGKRCILPACGAECFAFCKNLVRNAGEVVRIRVHGVAPPCLDAVKADGAIIRVLKGEEDDDQTDGVTRVQSSGQHIYHIK